MTLTYKRPKKPQTPFKRGQLVEVCDRDLTTMSVVKVVYAGKRITRLADGRRFETETGWWVGENGSWPFPSIRHST